MSRCSIAFGLTLCLSAGVLDAAAQDVRRSAPTSATAALAGQALGKKQIDLVRRVSAYFNQITNLKGTFLQTSTPTISDFVAISISLDPAASGSSSIHQAAWSFLLTVIRWQSKTTISTPTTGGNSAIRRFEPS